MKKMTLIYDSTKNSSDLLYKTKFKAPDPIIFFEIRKKTHLVLNDLELERGKKQAKVDEILSLREILNYAKGNKIENIIFALIKKYKVDEVLVPYTFPSYLFNKLVKLKVKLKASDSSIFYESRLIKDKAEIKNIRKNSVTKVK